MADLQPEVLLKSLEKGTLAPFYLLYGPDEFRMERVLERLRDEFIPDSARDFNLEIFYGGETPAAVIVSNSSTMPFMAQNRMIIVRRAELFKADQLEIFLPYLNDPSPSTCLVFVSSKTDFKKKFYKKIRAANRAVCFAELKDRQIVPWVKRTAKELGLKIDEAACHYLHQVVGNGLRDLYEELVKLQVRHGENIIRVEDVKELVIHSRVYSIFELMNAISVKDAPESLGVLNRFLEDGDRGVPFQIIGMLNRQIRILLQTKFIVGRGGKQSDVSGKLALAPFVARSFMGQIRHWTIDELEKGLCLLYKADSRLKNGSRPGPTLENLIVSLCR